jgi:hypothetical protein
LVPCPVAGDRRGCQRAIGQRPLDTALHRLMMTPSLWPTAQNEGFSRYASSICARDTRLASSSLDRESVVKAAISSSLIANSNRSPPSCHDTAPHFADRKRGIHQQPVRSTNSACSTNAGFTESVV